jgi:hypothetical protein
MELEKSFRSELNRHGLTLLDLSKYRLRCDTCGQEWSPNLRPGGRNPRGWWKCPNGCNQLSAEQRRESK